MIQKKTHARKKKTVRKYVHGVLFSRPGTAQQRFECSFDLLTNCKAKREFVMSSDPEETPEFVRCTCCLLFSVSTWNMRLDCEN